jgi:predicted small metal-binding protein
MTVKIECRDYGFECKFVLEGRKSISLIKKLREHFDSEHGIDYSEEAIIQMLVNQGHSRDSIRNE